MKTAVSLVTPERQAELHEAWNLIAEQKKGGLRKKEVYKVLRALGMAPTEYEWRQLWQRMEPVHGKVEFHGFSHVIEEQIEASLNVDRIQEAFELFDQDRKQYFDATDLDRVMRSLNEHLTEEQIKDMILEVDCQGDCRINRDEFLDMMCNF
mmetsp:Transcript_25077/g.77327  ORF Transcript_25077/g.77327 Transcript_25077/m.77327 type:complete len:152 (-) Transcript_25077:16-471(-)